MSRRRRQVAMLALVAVSASPWVLAMQAPQAPPATFRAATDLIQVDVSVLDKGRHPVRGLAAGDFVVLEDGQPRPVVAFTSVDLPDPKAGPPRGSWMRDVAPDVATNATPVEGRVVIIVIDRSVPPGEPWTAARKIAEAAIDQLGRGDLAAVVHTGYGGHFQGLTADRARLRRAIVDSSLEISDEAKGIEASLGVITAGQGSGQCYCGTCVLEAIASIASAVRDIDRRRKSLIFIGSDLALESSDIDCGPRLKDARVAMFHALDLANLPVYSFDPRGLETLAATASNRPRTPPAANLARQGNLSVLPDRTGGRTSLNANMPWVDMPAVFQESDSYYLLGFEPAHPHDGREHTIEVKVNRRGVTAQTRKKYAVTDAAASAVVSAVPKQGIGLEVNAPAFKSAAEPGRAMVAVTLGIRQAIKDGRAGPADVVVAALTPRGQPVATVRQTVAFTADSPETGKMDLDVFSKLTLPPGQYEIRAAIDDHQLATQGSVSAFIDVPNFDTAPPLISDPLVSTSPSRPASPRGLFAPDLPLAPTARRAFHRSERVTMFVRAYTTGTSNTAPIQLTVRVRDAANRVRVDRRDTIEASAFGGQPSADYQLLLPIADLADGEYLATIDAVRARVTAHRDLRFSVRSAAPAITPPVEDRAPAANAAADEIVSVLRAASAYLAEYERDVSAVVSEERYEQQAPSSQGTRLRILRSDFLQVNLGNAGSVGFRDVFEVDGKPVRDRDERLTRIFQDGQSNALEQGRRILEEGTRFNLNGDLTVQRTINMPLTALAFLSAANQPRSTFSRDGVETVAGVRCVVIRFSEQARPRMLQSNNNAAAQGKFWIDPVSGRVIRTQLEFETSKNITVKATIRVDYGVPAGLTLWMPLSMDERYAQVPGGGTLSGRATYSKFRQFNVNVGEIIK